MSTLDSIKSFFPKYKQQLLFLREREKLFAGDLAMNDNKENEVLERCSVATPDPVIPPNDMSVVSLVTTDPQEATIGESSIHEITIERTPDPISDFRPKTVLPDEYPIPSLPLSLLNDIDRGDLSKFNNHCRNRQILIDAVFFDLTTGYNLWYPSREDYDKIANAILNLLRIPKSRENMIKWREIVQTKYKKERRPNVTNEEIKLNKEKYSCSTSGRPVKRKQLDAAQRDRQKQISLFKFDDGATSTKDADQLSEIRNGSVVDEATLFSLWRSTLHSRRTTIRNRTTEEIMTQCPEYSRPALVFEEVKLTTGVDICAAVRRHTPTLLEKFSSGPTFVNDSMPIRLIKILCRHFQEASHHIVNASEPTSPYPSIIMTDDVFHIYVDFMRITSTNSPDDALALTLAMFSVFELSFEKNGRVLRFLYAILFGDKRYLSNSTRNLVREKSINIYAEQNLVAVPNTTSNSPPPDNVKNNGSAGMDREPSKMASPQSSDNDLRESETSVHPCKPCLSERSSNLANIPQKMQTPSDEKQIPTRSKRAIDASTDREKHDLELSQHPPKLSSSPVVDQKRSTEPRRTTRQRKKTKTN